jgi:hypothetical protein
MYKARIVRLQACMVLWLAASFASPVIAALRQEQDKLTAVVFLDVVDLPARIDEPKLHRTDAGFVLKCAVANRSSEQLLGLRLILLVVEPSGKLRSRITWTDASELAGYSIKSIALHPTITEALRSTDRLFLVIDEVIGHETIWRVVGAEKVLRAYSRGRHDDLPTVRTVANQFDPRSQPLSIRVIH